jgi:hypothetical protein
LPAPVCAGGHHQLIGCAEQGHGADAQERAAHAQRQVHQVIIKFRGGSMKTLVAFVIILFQISLFQTSFSYRQSQDPKELIKPAAVIEEVITRISSGQTLQQDNHGPQGTKEIIENPARKSLLQSYTGTQPFVPQRAGYYDTVWPSEHTDLWRSHAVLNAGLPTSFTSEQLSVTTAMLNLPVWGYTRAQHEVFVAGGSPFLLDSFTQAIKTGEPLSGSALIRSILNDLFNDSIPYVAKIDPRTMEVTQLDLTGGSTVNYTGGLLMHENGFVYAVSRSILYMVDPRTMLVVRSLRLPLVGDEPVAHYWTTYNGLQVLASGELVLKGFHLLDSTNVPGWLLLVDPDDLTIDVQQSEAVSSARLTIQQSADGRSYLYHVNELDSLRFEITNTGFVLDDAWTRSYRTPDSGSTQASSPLLFGQIGQVVFADNTAQGATTPINLYTQAVDTNALPDDLMGTPAFSKSLPGYNFFMVAGDPFERQLLVYYDPINNLLAAHRVTTDGTLESVWEHDTYKVSASPAIVPDRDLLYIDDYRDGKDHLVILRLSTGLELASIELAATLPTIGTIFPGMNNDVYILSSEAGGNDGVISRVYIPEP